MSRRLGQNGGKQIGADLLDVYLPFSTPLTSHKGGDSQARYVCMRHRWMSLCGQPHFTSRVGARTITRDGMWTAGRERDG